MIDLQAVHHDTNLAHITITRIGDARNTHYRVQQLEADTRTDAPFDHVRIQNRLALLNYDTAAALQSSDFLRRKYGHNPTQEEGQGLPHQEL